jgi:SnoaL-like polyketide cyclase
MSFDVEALFRLWTDPLPERSAAEDAFRALYTDPVSINGVAVSAGDLVKRARAMQAVFEDPERELLDIAEAPGKVAIAFRLRGRQVGPLSTAAGVLAPSGQVVDLRVIDILTLTDGLISSIWMVADELGALAAINAVDVRLQPRQ